MTATHVAIESEILKWSPAERIDLAERLLASVDDFTSEDVSRAWKKEIAQRVADAESGKVIEISSQEVFAEARKKLNEARKVSSSRKR